MEMGNMSKRQQPDQENFRTRSCTAILFMVLHIENLNKNIIFENKIDTYILLNAIIHSMTDIINKLCREYKFMNNNRNKANRSFLFLIKDNLKSESGL